MSDDRSSIPIKKRATKGNTKQRLSESSDEDYVDMTALQDIKFEQKLRTKKAGASLNLLSKSASLKNSSSDHVATSAKSIESALGSQFSIEASYGAQTTVHEKIMNQFIDEKLGGSKRCVVAY
jgi:hypothetical protein